MAKLDLNLMAVLDAIYDEGNTSRAGDVLFLSQSAVSHALARLRDIYQDPLFVRRGHRMVPTALTERIIPRVKLGLREMRASIDEAHNFDPFKHRQEFQLGMRDAIETALLGSLMGRLEEVAPLVHLSTRQISPNNLEDQLSVGKLDLCLELLKPVSPQIHHRLLFRETLVLVGREKHPALTKGCTLEDFLQHRQLLVTPLESEPEWVDHALASRGLRRNVVLRCQSYTSALQALLESDHLSIMPKAYVELMSKFMPVKYISVPFDVPTIEIHLYWHQRQDSNPANRWLREQLVMALNEIAYIELNPMASELVKEQEKHRL